MTPRDMAPQTVPGDSPPAASRADAGPRPGAARVWFQAIRPWSFAASVVPVTVGGACAILVGQFSLPAFLLCMVGGVALQAGTNMVNDYYDWRQGADHTGSLGPSRVIQQGWLSPRAVLLGGLGFFTFAGLCGFVLTALAGWSILLLGLVGVPLAYGYTAPPLKLAYRGLGELNVFCLMGPVMVLGGVLVHGTAGVGAALAASIPVGFLVASILHANNIRDLDDDRQLGKRTIATLVGMRWAKREFDVLVFGAYAVLVGAVALRRLPWTALLALLSLPLALRAHRTVTDESDPKRLAPAVRQAATLHLYFGLLLALGLALAGWRRR